MLGKLRIRKCEYFWQPLSYRGGCGYPSYAFPSPGGDFGQREHLVCES